jgi:hypothetical protein
LELEGCRDLDSTFEGDLIKSTVAIPVTVNGSHVAYLVESQETLVGYAPHYLSYGLTQTTLPLDINLFEALTVLTGQRIHEHQGHFATISEAIETEAACTYYFNNSNAKR